MILYLVVIFITLGLIMVVNSYLSYAGIIDYSIRYVVLFTLIIFVFEFLVNLICVCVPRYVCPKKMMYPERKIYTVHKWESKLYNRLKINKWKDIIPELGCLAGFVKTKVESDDPSYLLKFAEETVYAEVMHTLSAILSFTILLIPPYDLMFNITFWIAIVSFGLNILPIFVQRYNRPRLLRMYYRELKIRRKKAECSAEA